MIHTDGFKNAVQKQTAIVRHIGNFECKDSRPVYSVLLDDLNGGRVQYNCTPSLDSFIMLDNRKGMGGKWQINHVAVIMDWKKTFLRSVIEHHAKK